MSWALVLILTVALAIACLRARVHRRHADRLDNIRCDLLGQLAVAARKGEAAKAGYAAARADAGQLRAHRDQLAAENASLRSQLRSSLRWRNELRNAAEEQAYLMNPDPPRGQRERDAWNSRWSAIFDAPSRIPPHEQQDQDGADQ